MSSFLRARKSLLLKNSIGLSRVILDVLRREDHFEDSYFQVEGKVIPVENSRPEVVFPPQA